jgi:hypothetical protein
MDNYGSGNRRGGEQPEPQDAQVGGWSRAERERMDERFREAFTRALRSGQETKAAAAATVRAEKH